MEEYSANFRIADVTIGLRLPKSVEITEHFREFYTEEEPEQCISFRQVLHLPQICGKLLYRGKQYEVYEENGVLFRLFKEYSNGFPYAVGCYPALGSPATVDYLPEGAKHLHQSDNCFFHIGWERLMLQYRRLILHACCVSTEEGGICFSGPSGIGKSTQGTLWCEYENASMINGDRPILSKHSGEWMAYGSPYAGSSRCHVNEKTPLRAIVMLQQAETCSVRRLHTAEAFRKVFAQLTVNSWDRECMQLAMDLAEQLVETVPVYEMACTPDEIAVKLLKETLVREGRL